MSKDEIADAFQELIDKAWEAGYKVHCVEEFPSWANAQYRYETEPNTITLY